MYRMIGKFSFRSHSLHPPLTPITESYITQVQHAYISPILHILIFILWEVQSTVSSKRATSVNASKAHSLASATSLLNKQKLTRGTKFKLIWLVHGPSRSHRSGLFLCWLLPASIPFPASVMHAALKLNSPFMFRIFYSLWLSRYPRPLRCIHDNGTEFTAPPFQYLLQHYGI